MSEYKDLAAEGMWNNNPALVQLLGLCPLLAVTATVINGLGLGLATMAVLIGSNVTVSLVRNIVRNEIRIPIFVMIIASFVTIIQLLMNAFTYELYLALGIFIPLIVTNCAIIGRAPDEATSTDKPDAPLSPDEEKKQRVAAAVARAKAKKAQREQNESNAPASDAPGETTSPDKPDAPLSPDEEKKQRIAAAVARAKAKKAQREKQNENNN